MTGDHTFDDEWFDVIWFFDLLHFQCHTRTYSISVEICISSWSCMFIPTYRIHAKMMTCLLSYHDPLIEPLSQAHIFRHLGVIMFLLLGDVSLMFGFDSSVDLDDWDHTFDDGWFDVIWFYDLLHFRCHTGAYSVSVEICRSSWSCMFIPTYEIYAETMTYLLSYHDLLVEPFSSHSAKPTLFGIWMSSCFFF